MQISIKHKKSQAILFDMIETDFTDKFLKQEKSMDFDKIMEARDKLFENRLNNGLKEHKEFLKHIKE